MTRDQLLIIAYIHTYIVVCGMYVTNICVIIVVGPIILKKLSSVCEKPE